MDHRTVLDLERAGVSFEMDLDGRPSIRAKTPELLAAARYERERRGRMMLARAPAAGAWPLIKIVDREPARWGECLTCAEPIAAHRSGMCALCAAGLKWALKETGKL